MEFFFFCLGVDSKDPKLREEKGKCRAHPLVVPSSGNGTFSAATCPCIPTCDPGLCWHNLLTQKLVSAQLPSSTDTGAALLQSPLATWLGVKSTFVFY